MRSDWTALAGFSATLAVKKTTVEDVANRAGIDANEALPKKQSWKGPVERLVLYVKSHIGTGSVV